MRILLLIAIFGTVAQHCSAQVCNCTASGGCQYGVAVEGAVLVRRFCDDPTDVTSQATAFSNLGFTVLNSTVACNRGVCGDNSSCAENTTNIFICSCQTYFEATRATATFGCTDFDECANSADNNCDTNATCSNESPSFSCLCNAGYSGNGTYCEDINECAASPCGSNAGCTEPVPDNYTCTCDTGYTGDPYTNCTDINECTVGLLSCDSNASCSNTIGSFTCTCNPGFTGNGISCTDIDECANIALHSCPINSLCQNEPGNYTCVCDAGLTGDSSNCTDIDECANSALFSCPNNSSCVNRPSGLGYTCVCDAGFTGNDTYCEDINECTNRTLFNCPNNSTCQNEPNGNGHTCVCDAGFTGNSTYCEDLNECSNFTLNTCPNNSTCTNGVNGDGFTCTCHAGFTGNQTHCEDIRECDFNPCDINAACAEPRADNYTCTCNTGWAGDGFACGRPRQAICIEFDLTCDSLSFDADLGNTSSVLYQNVTGSLATAIQSFISNIDAGGILENVNYTFVNSTDGRGLAASTVQLCINNTDIVEDVYLNRVDTIFEGTCGVLASPDECALQSPCDSGKRCVDSSFGYCCYQDIVDVRISLRFNLTFNVTNHGDSAATDFADVCNEAISQTAALLNAKQKRGCTQQLNITCEKLVNGSVEAILMMDIINGTFTVDDIIGQLQGAAGTGTPFGTILSAGDFDECSDNYELDRNCSAFANCLNSNGSFSCGCNNTYFDNGTTPGQICISPITISCDSSNLTVSILEAYYNVQNVNLSSLHLADESCTRDIYGTIVGDSIEFNVAINDCNTTLTTAADNTTIIASNYISNRPSSGAFTGLEIRVPFECQLPGSLNISAQFTGHVNSIVLPNVDATGEFTLKLALFDETFTTEKNSSTSFGSTEIVYLQVSVENDITNLGVKLGRCWGTATSVSSATDSVEFVKNGCPTQQVKQVNLISNGVGPARFSFQMFFFTQVNAAFLHCTLSVCTPSCATTCSGRKRRNVDPVEETGEVTLTLQVKLRPDDPLFNNRTFDIIGINNQQPIIPGNKSTTQDITLPIVCAILAFVLIILLALVVVVAVRKRRSSKDAYDMTHVNMHAIGVKPPAY